MHDQENLELTRYGKRGRNATGSPLALAMSVLAEWTKGSARPLVLARR